MLPPMLRLPLLLALLLLPATAAAQNSIFGNPDDLPGEGGDAVLPAGYQGILWGISPEALMAVRGRAMEPLNTPDPHLTMLIESSPPGEEGGISTLKWKFWDRKLMEVAVFYSGPFTKREGRELRNKFVTKYGEALYKAVERERPPMLSTKVDWQSVQEETWTWQDPFTIQALHRRRRGLVHDPPEPRLRGHAPPARQARARAGPVGARARDRPGLRAHL